MANTTATGIEATWFERWMAGHNGPDAISRILAILSVALIVTGLLTQVAPVIIIAVIMLVVAFWRTLSTNIIQRRKEEDVVLRHSGFLRPWLANPKAAYDEHRRYVHVTCPTCGQKARLPRGVGKVLVVCPQCSTKYEDRG